MTEDQQAQFRTADQGLFTQEMHSKSRNVLNRHRFNNCQTQVAAKSRLKEATPMAKPSTLYTRRLSRTESGLWLNLDESRSSLVQKDALRGYMDAFVSLSGALLYLSSVESNPIGGTAAYRDSVACTLCLVSVRMKPSFRKELLSLMIKSSLPFFRSASIVQVEALVNHSRNRNGIPFPLAYDLPAWVMPILEANGFQKAEQLCHYSAENISGRKAAIHGRQWDSHPDLARADALFRKAGTESGLSCSQAHLAVSVAAGLRSLKTLSVKGRALALTGFMPYGKRALVTVCLHDSEKLDVTQFAAGLLNLCVESRVKSLDLLLVGQGQRELVGSLAEICSSPFKRELLQMMRKVL